MDICYLDHAASTPPRFFASDYFNYWANPNSPHKGGLEAHQALNEAKARIKKALGVKSGEIIIGGTASQLFGCLIQQLDNCE